jgi:hypothetical protein
VRSLVAQFAVAALAGAAAAGCAPRAAEQPAAAEASRPGAGDWSQFGGSQQAVDPRKARVVQEAPVEITGSPHVRSVRLSWSAAAEVPSFEPDNQTLRLPPETRQAVLAVTVVGLPADADLRVDWYYGEDRVFADAIGSREDGDHFFALVKRDGRRLVELPKGRYRAEVTDGGRPVKTVRFEVT